MIYLGLDPGINGGIATIDERGHLVDKITLAGTDRDTFGFLSSVKRCAEMDNEDVFAVLELVRASPQMGVVSAFTFGRGYGALQMALLAAGIPFDQVVPRKWQAALGIAYPADATDTQKKNLTKARAQALFPGVTITHATADALLIAEYGRRQREHRHGEEEPREEVEGQRQGRHQKRPAKAAPRHGAGPARAARRPVRVDR